MMCFGATTKSKLSFLRYLLASSLSGSLLTLGHCLAFIFIMAHIKNYVDEILALLNRTDNGLDRKNSRK